MTDPPEIVCICGSARFVDEMNAANRELTLAGAIVVAPSVLANADGNAGDVTITDEQRTSLGELHLRKIDLADRVLVVNPGGYIGESTSREVTYAEASGKRVSYTDPGARSCRQVERGAIAVPRRGSRGPSARPRSLR